jgi:1-acyl-sn-glycerol-3-phosphate acyltransferase
MGGGRSVGRRPAGRLRRVLDAALTGLSRLLLRVFFREVEVVGADRIPRGVPLVIVANHVNSLVDPILLLGFSGARPRFLAKSTLWSHPVVAPLLVLAGALPVYRHKDGVDVAHNFETFARCHAHLGAGGSIALFPEGGSHNLPHGLPLKTGAARIALEACAQHPGLGLRIVPVGLIYEAKDRFRSRVLLQAGPPLDPAPELEQYAAGGRAAVRTLTRRIARALEEVTVSYESWDEARAVDRAVDLLSGDQAGAERPLSSRTEWRRGVVRAYRALRAHDPQRVAAVAGAVARYDQAYRALWDEAELDSPGDPDAGARRTRLSPGGRVLLILPAAAGAVLNVVPFRLSGALSRRFTRTPDEPATFKLLAALLLFPLFWAAEVGLAAAASGPPAAITAAIAAPATGYLALLVREDRQRRRVEARRRLETTSGRRVPSDLREQRDRLRVALEALASEYEALTARAEAGAPGVAAQRV